MSEIQLKDWLRKHMAGLGQRCLSVYTCHFWPLTDSGMSVFMTQSSQSQLGHDGIIISFGGDMRPHIMKDSELSLETCLEATSPRRFGHTVPTSKSKHITSEICSRNGHQCDLWPPVASRSSAVLRSNLHVPEL